MAFITSCMQDTAEHYPKRLIMCNAGGTILNPESELGFALQLSSNADSGLKAELV